MESTEHKSIQSLILVLHIKTGTVFPMIGGHQTYASFLNLISQFNPALSTRLHDEPRYRPYTTALLRGIPGSRGLTIHQNELLHYLRVTLLDGGTLWHQLHAYSLKSGSPQIQLGDTAFQLIQILSSPETDPTGWASTDESGWNLLPYQVLQAQGKQQAISRARGVVNLAGLGRLHQRVGAQVLASWQWLLQKPPEAHPYELDHLIEALINCRRSEWENHLLEVARVELLHKPSQASNSRKNRLRLYSLQEVQEVSDMMESTMPTPLSTILTRREGTMRFGHALRQLRQLDSSPAHEILDDLEAVSTCDQLMDVLTRAMQTCEVMDAKSPFMIVPSDPDLKLLLEDVERYGAHTVAELLRLLSTLRYALRRKEADQREDIQSHGEASAPSIPDEADESA